ncbi:MAG: class I SAM-dependent methyltransferase [Bacteroidota bacterium]|jgi:predicted hydrocarbon binding protein|nr:class I SAM-dependent methyltransferase [Bacteroidota bacterium]|tara:strand:- start:109 stop:867 length:759 start_codon:yes stop_codon:yes gene_type:complete
MADNNTKILTYDNESEKSARDEMYNLLKKCPIPEEQVLSNLGLFLNSKNLSRILFMNYIYQKQIDVHGVLMEFGTRWGQNVALFAALRGMYEPFNRHKKLIAFDTFEGFPEITEEDGTSSMMVKGELALTTDYDKYLSEVVQNIENDNPLSHIKKFELVKGDATKTIHTYLKDNPETIVSLAYFDFDLYKPTKECLEAIKPRLTKGSVVAFDELNDPDSPGETLALMEVFGLQNVKLKRFPYASRVSYFIVE